MGKVIARAYLSIVNVNDGEKGETALTLVVTPNTFVFQTNNKGIIENLTQNTGTVKMYAGTTEVPIDSVSAKPYNCDAVVYKQQLAGQAGIPLYILEFKSVAQGQWSGKVEVTATYKGQARTAIAEFMVSAQKWNEAQFLANEQQFKSIIAQNKADKQGLERRISTIEQDAGNIRLEVSRQTFSGVNMLKGASLRREKFIFDGELIDIYGGRLNQKRIEIKDHDRCAYIHTYGFSSDTNGGLYFVAKINGKGAYTFSFYAQVATTPDRGMFVSSCLNSTPTTRQTWLPQKNFTLISNGLWNKYTFTIEVPDTVCRYLECNIRIVRNGEVRIKEIQLEEGTKATAWKDPDVVESVERTGIDLTNGTVSVEAANFEIKHNGEKPFAVSKGKALLGGWVFDKGKLFSQCGDINGNPSTDYGNANFTPDIVLDPVNGYMSGVGSFRKKVLTITPQNIENYAKTSYELGTSYVFLAGKISAAALFKGTFKHPIFITLPGNGGNGGFEVARTILGETIVIYNQSSSYINIWGSGSSISVYPNQFAALEVKISVDKTGTESYYNYDWIKGKMLV
ncbi:hypothetical protein [Prevotella sp. HUN102]|uniref:hypothetical protein n=1 Tax=Prevotella sp. HUN102 TaxID=1392486 RepID=UPI00048A5EF4|nr:hypothetical protein [Prevotella sp. HUN102]